MPKYNILTNKIAIKDICTPQIKQSHFIIFGKQANTILSFGKQSTQIYNVLRMLIMCVKYLKIFRLFLIFAL